QGRVRDAAQARGRGPVHRDAAGGTVVFRGRSATDLGRWNARYGAVYQLGFSGLTRIGQYRVTVQTASGAARSPAFRVDSPAALYQGLAGNGVRYFTSERDGPDVD